MALKRNMNPNEMVDFINNELLPQTEQEIKNLIYPKKKQGGYFVVTRQILCMVDFLGAVYAGYHHRERRYDPHGKRIATSAKAIRFISTFFEPKQTYQTRIITMLHDMYRNGLVHLYQPKILRLNSRSRLQWFLYKGRRYQKTITVDTDKGKLTFNDIDHLKIICNDPQRRKYYLAICIDALYEDFVKAVEKYRDKLRNTRYLQTHWHTTVNAICKPR